MTKEDPNITSDAIDGASKAFRNLGIMLIVPGSLAVLVHAEVQHLLGWLLLAWASAMLLFADSFKELSGWKVVTEKTV